MRGRFIVFEGLDRSGKSTQVDNLAKKINENGGKAVVRKFPDRTTAIGKMIDAYLQNAEELDDNAVHLLFSANRWETVASIQRDLQSGIDVIADRYAFSGIAFSAAKGLDFDYCLNPDKGLPLPDVTLFLTLPPEIASQRAAYGTERYEKVEIQQRVREQFVKVRDKMREVHGHESWRDIDASGSIEEIGAHIWQVVQAVGAQSSHGQLWQNSNQ